MMYSKAISALSALDVKGMDFGVERTRELLDALESPDKKLKIIHIAGTNGKGSTAEYLEKILLAAGKSVGKFTSPAVFDYLEQFQVDGKNVPEELFAKAVQSALSHADGATRFEVETAAALYAFVLAGCEYAVVECGLGGTYDATNAILSKEVAVICSIGLEHTSILGGTIEEICRHKAGIIKNCPAVVSGLNSQNVLNYFENFGAVVAGKYENPPMCGEAQKYNAGLAIEVAKLLKIDESAIYAGVNAAKLCGRIEVLTAKDGKRYVLDGAHNPSAMAPLAEFVNAQFGYADVIFGSLSDKNVRENLKIISGFAKKIAIVPCPSVRNISMEKLKNECRSLSLQADEFESTAAALENVQGNNIVVCGSFTLLSGAKEWIEKRL
jgi:dihydrofolate synthase/folylpolyglutamate synthase